MATSTSVVLAVYKYTASFPKEERYCLISQFRLAATSIAANIAEGYAKRSKLDNQNIKYCTGSLEESRYYILLSSDLDYGRDKNLEKLSEEVIKLLKAYLKAIESSK